MFGCTKEGNGGVETRRAAPTARGAPSAITPLWTALGAAQGRDETRLTHLSTAGWENSIAPFWTRLGAAHGQDEPQFTQ